MNRVLVAGCGYVGSALAERLAAEGVEVWGLRRRTATLPAGVRPLAADLRDPATLRKLPPGLDTVFYTAGADGSGDDAYRAAYLDGVRHLLGALADQGQRPARVLLTSSTGVYAQQNGEWVDELSPTEPRRPAKRLLLAGEDLLIGGPFPATVVRFGGIYGPGRTGLVERVRRGAARCSAGPPRFSNRIHRDDCAGVLRHLALLPGAGPLYLGVDHEPAELCTVLRWIAARVGVPPPEIEAAPAPRGSNKRCTSALLRASGYRFQHPTFREGFGALLGG